MTVPLLTLLGLYLGLGFLFGVVFVAAGGPKKIDPSAAEGTLGFRLLILPGCAIFWPLLLRRWISGSPPPTESSAHRSKSRS